MTPKILGLIGYPLTHSFSKSYFKQKFEKEKITDYIYRNFELPDLKELPYLIQNTPNLTGLNVTIPYKEKVLTYVDEVSPEVAAVGAANTLVIHPVSKKISAYNTDIYGFRQSLLAFLKPWHRKALILGTGGAAKAIDYTLQQMGIETLMVSRQPENERQITYDDLTEQIVKMHLLVINTTPVGQFPDTEKSPFFPYDFITVRHFFYDLIYNPPETKFLYMARKRGAVTCNGLKMLHLQAERSWKIWTK